MNHKYPNVLNESAQWQHHMKVSFSVGVVIIDQKRKT